MNDFCHYCKIIHEMLSVKIAKLFQEVKRNFLRLARHFMNFKMDIMNKQKYFLSNHQFLPLPRLRRVNYCLERYKGKAI